MYVGMYVCVHLCICVYKYVHVHIIITYNYINIHVQTFLSISPGFLTLFFLGSGGLGVAPSPNPPG